MAADNWAAWLLDQLGERNWTRADFIRKANGRVDSGQLSRWLNGQAKPTRKSVQIVCATLDVPPVYGLIAAGFLTAEELGGQVIQRPPRGADALSDDELLTELGRRLRRAAEPQPGGRGATERGAEGYVIDYEPDKISGGGNTHGDAVDTQS